MAVILGVDDSATMRQMVSLALGDSGHEVVQACDGVEALKIAKTRPFDLVLTDLNMPNMNGIELIRELRQIDAYRFVPILMLTTESGMDRKTDGKEAGATGWIVKPFQPESLLTTIQKGLR